MEIAVLKLSLQEDDRAAIEELTGELAQRFDTVESPDFQRECRTYAQELPRAVRSALNEYHRAERSGMFVLSGLAVDDDGLGPTPPHWRDLTTRSSTFRHDAAFFLISCLLGEPIGWATQQDGRVMHDIFPIQEHQHDQIGWGSGELLSWHTEDAFHPLRTDYLGLMCLRNPDDVETTAADIADVRLGEEVRKFLHESRFHILPDDSHRARNQTPAADEDPKIAELRQSSLQRVERALSSPEPVAVLFGSPDSPYLRIDPYYMQDVHDEPEEKALAAIGAAIDAAMGGVVLHPGDVCFIDNYRMVHGRKPFRARYDGTDRWLRRLNVTRDLRKSREYRLSAESPVIY